MALVSFKSPLATGRLPIFSPEFVFVFFFFTDPFLSVLGIMPAVISDAAFSYSEVKVCGTYELYN